VNTFSIDLGAPFYWVFLGLAVLIVTPITRREPRRVVLAVLDLLFVTLLTAPWGGAAAAGFAFVIHQTASGGGSRDARSRYARALYALGGAIVLVLFVIHKLAARSHDSVGHAPVVLLLDAVGFSYVALRSVERLRAGADGVSASNGWLDTVSYLFPFHMLAAGPIQSWDGFQRQHAIAAPLSFTEGLSAVDRIVHGLFKKFVIARVIELTLLTKFTAPWPYQLIEVQAYYLWVYLDFSAYSDLAVGAAGLLGVPTPENFNRPLRARNIIMFWERWHMSLSSFVRRNVFIPVQLTLMRRSNGAHPLFIASVAFAVSFLLVGLWHGISLRFLLWGAMHAAALIICTVFRHVLIARVGRSGFDAYMANPLCRVLATVVTFEFVAFSLAFIVHPATAFLD
jgi:D-alanyl-lipoteichoic acid acyltransferase DltB (MBOAT superfamily)